MSDDEDITYVKRSKTIHYGSLEETERNRQATLEDIESDEDAYESTTNNTTTTPAVVPAAAAAAEQPIKKPQPPAAAPPPSAKLDDEYYDIEAEVSKDKLALLEEFERKRRARQINVSTDDAEIKKNLRQLNEPICYFGEGPAERRRRLKELLASLGENAIKQKQTEEEERKQLQKEQETTWYHEGPESLRISRFWIADYSLPRAKQRLEKAKSILELPSATRAGRMVELQKRLQSLAPLCSQVGDTRPVSDCAFSEDSSMMLTSSWSGLCKLWTVPDCDLKQTLRGHASYVGGVAFRSKVSVDDTNVVSMASCGHDGAVKLWCFGSEESIADITGHMPHRVSKLAFHPSGRFLATACYDSSWRLWDLEQRTEVLHQEGHAKAVHCVAFQTDGSVIVTGGLDAFGRVWDLRTGRCIMFLEGHLGSIFGVDFSSNGYHIATGSQDNSCKIWDLRRRQPVYTIPAHTNLISDVKYEPDGGNFLVTSSYDCTTKIWSNKTWQPLKTLLGHDGKVVSVDISGNSQYIATTSFDRTFKLWTPEG